MFILQDYFMVNNFKVLSQNDISHHIFERMVLFDIESMFTQQKSENFLATFENCLVDFTTRFF